MSGFQQKSAEHCRKAHDKRHGGCRAFYDRLDSCQAAQAGGWRLEAGGWRLEAGGWRLEAGGWTGSLRNNTGQAFSSGFPASSALIGLSLLDIQVVEDTFRRLASFEDRRDHQIGAAHHVAAGEDLRVAGLVLERAHFRRDHPPLAVSLDVLRGKPVGRARAETEGDQ